MEPAPFESALRKVDAGRIDAFLWAQEEADLVQGRLEPPYERIHRPFDPWQPAG